MDDITRKSHLTAAAVGTNISGVRTVGDLGRKGAFARPTTALSAASA